MAMEVSLPVASITRHLCIPDGEEDALTNLPLAICPSRMCVAVAVDTKVAVFNLSGTPTERKASKQEGKLLGSSTASQDAITSLLWVIWEEDCHSGLLQPTDTSVDAAHLPESAVDNSKVREPPSAHACLLVGTASGYLQLHDSNGEVLLRQRLHNGAVVRMQLRSRNMGLCPLDQTQDVTLTFSNAVARILSTVLSTSFASCLAARAHAEAVAAAAAKERAGSWSAMAWTSSAYNFHALPGPEVVPIACQKWSMPRCVGPRCDALYLGTRAPSLYEVLQDAGYSEGDGYGSGLPAGRVVLATAGQGPALAALDGPESSHSRSGIGALVSSLYALARTAHSQVTSGPTALRQGIKSLLLSPLLSFDANKRLPVATFEDPATGCQGEPTPYVWKSIRDDPRTMKTLLPAPRGSLMAATDNLGRVLLVDASSQFSVLRMLKGYRDSTCGWLELPTGLVQQFLELQHGAQDNAAQHHHDEQQQCSSQKEQQCLQHQQQQHLHYRHHYHHHHHLYHHQQEPYGGDSGPTLDRHKSFQQFGTAFTLVLIIHAPRRQMVEAWLPPYGPRLHVLHRPGNWMLLQPPPQFVSTGSINGTQACTGSSIQGSCRGKAQGLDGVHLSSAVLSDAGGVQGGGSPVLCEGPHLPYGNGHLGQHSSKDLRQAYLAQTKSLGRASAVSGCWLLDPSTGTASSLSVLLSLELAATVSRAQTD